MREYFDAEMRLLHEAAHEFAQLHPEQARMLNLKELRDRDPYIERLLEGMAFLSSHIRRRLDESEAAVSEQLLAQICPQQLAPYPATTIVQFRLEAYRHHLQELAAGLELLAEPVGKHRVQCRFRTTQPLTVQPLSLEEVGVEEKGGSLTRLRLGFRCEGAARVEELKLAGLPLFIHADHVLAAALYQALTAGVRRLSLRLFGKHGERTVEVGGQERIRPLHLEPEDALVARPHKAHAAFDLLQDYFLSREKYLFVALDLPEALDWPGECKRFELEILCAGALPPEHKLRPENLRLHCVPAVNLFSVEAEPVDLDHRRSEYRLLPDARYPQEVLVVAVDAVSGREQRSGAVHEYRPLYAVRSRARGERYYHARRRDFGAATPHTYLSVGGHERLERETLSVQVTACNGHLPRQHLHENQIHIPSSQVPSGVRFRNITRPTPLWQPPGAAEFPWRLNALLALNVGSLASAEALRQLLELFEWSGRREQRQRADAITAVAAEPLNTLVEGVLHRGVEVRIQLQEGCFASTADVYLFGQVLHRVLSLFAPLDEFVQTRLVCQPSFKELLWAPRLGRSCPI